MDAGEGEEEAGNCMVTEGGRCTGVDSKRPACSLIAAHTALLASSALSTWSCKNSTVLCYVMIYDNENLLL